MPEVTELLAAARVGDSAALDAVFSAVYPDLKRLARARLARHAPITLIDTTAVVHEGWLKMQGLHGLDLKDRSHFFGYAARVMRSVIVDAVRAGQRERRGGHATHLPLSSELSDRLAQSEDEILEVDAALAALARLAPRLAQVVEMRYFAGMTEIEIASALGVTDRTVRRDWDKARLLLAEALRA